jgi:hypothetical protein
LRFHPYILILFRKLWVKENFLKQIFRLLLNPNDPMRASFLTFFDTIDKKAYLANKELKGEQYETN